MKKHTLIWILAIAAAVFFLVINPFTAGVLPIRGWLEKAGILKPVSI